MSGENSVWEKLRAPFPPEEVRAVVVAENVNQKGEHWVVLAPTVDLEAIEERLDEVAPGWSMEVLQITPVTIRPRGQKAKAQAQPVEGFYALVRLTVEGLARDGVGMDTDPRAAVSMAFKNAARRFGVGRYLQDRRMYKTVKVGDERVLRRLALLTFEEAVAALKGEAPNLPPRPAKPEPTPVPVAEDEEAVPF